MLSEAAGTGQSVELVPVKVKTGPESKEGYLG